MSAAPDRRSACRAELDDISAGILNDTDTLEVTILRAWAMDLDFGKELVADVVRERDAERDAKLRLYRAGRDAQ